MALLIWGEDTRDFPSASSGLSPLYNWEPFKAVDLFDELNGYCIDQDGCQTLCNSNFQVGSASSIALAFNDTLCRIGSANQCHVGGSSS